ncbi:hypothetical protein Pmar_PMAR022929 [Perkinsus marinus ATCC 50983]|uniref:Uncharacterized protein n=2 Tax=Perkinsus marinus (strain ATCC 50983 / TXsc) TaxID=423536 RepID=C5LSW4_PERM5|nr:hypothetical protein Pmar_PMAR022929 [Perkinsus marinus ATCC 50983]EER00178.1 hypothetical protein Pmar_PMAR022929 [Perkinsus marinus ATCC 50983]|eukprot:XP_002767460.1 hypothetical protein Pmar_PMAR022929 [Perkinsus marinus ATCC 50983]
MSTSSTTFSECLKETDACRRPNFEGLNASEATFAARQVLRNMSVLKTEEQRRQDIIRCQEEEAIRRKQEELIEKAAEERRAIKAKLEKVRLEQLEKDESQALVRQRQEVASAIEALKEAQNRCTQHKKQIEEDILNASISLMESRIKLPVKAVEDIPKSSATFELSGGYTDLGADGFSTPPPKSTSGGSLSGWLGDAIRTFRRHLKGHSPEAVYIDLCEDRYGNGSDHSSLALGCRD